MTCLLHSIGFAAQLSGAKIWRLHAFSAQRYDDAVGKNEEGDVIYEGLVTKGEVLVFAPWLPHETINAGAFCY
jgi:hypothetical protein